MASTDVLIVGAGPSGLALANVLAELRVGFIIVDKKSGPVRESRAVVHVRTLELLDKLGLAGTAVGRGVKIGGVELFERCRRVAEFPLAGEGAEGLTPFPYALGLEQYRFTGTTQSKDQLGDDARHASGKYKHLRTR